MSLLVTYNFPPLIKAINLTETVPLETNIELHLNIKGKLYQSDIEQTVTYYTNFESESPTATLWPHYSFSSPITFNRELKIYKLLYKTKD